MTAPEKLIAVEYHDGHPHSVTTSNGKGWTVWDFDWCKRDQTVYYHQSGGGPAEAYHVGKLGRGGRAELWVDSSVMGFADCSSGKPLTRRQVERYGYKLLKKLKADPFEDAVGGRVTWCVVCQDQLPDDHACWHLLYVPGDALLLGCGTAEIPHEDHHESLLKLLQVLGPELVQRLADELAGAGARWECSCPGGEADQLDLRDPVTRENVELDSDKAAAAGVEWEDLFVGMAWIASMEPGKTTKAIKLTIRWMRAWLREVAT